MVTSPPHVVIFLGGSEMSNWPCNHIKVYGTYKKLFLKSPWFPFKKSGPVCIKLLRKALKNCLKLLLKCQKNFFVKSRTFLRIGDFYKGAKSIFQESLRLIRKCWQVTLQCCELRTNGVNTICLTSTSESANSEPAQVKSQQHNTTHFM